MQGIYNLVRTTKFVYANQQYMIATKSWVKNDQMSKNMEQVMNIKCNQEKDIHHWPTSPGNTSQEFANEARIESHTKRAGHFSTNVTFPRESLTY